MKKKLDFLFKYEKKFKDSTISSPDNFNNRILGSYSALEKFKQKDDDNLPDDFPDGGDYPPPPQVSTPDLALQFKSSLEGINLTQINDKVIAAIKSAYGSNVDVRFSGSSDIGRIGIWFRASVTERDNQARDRGLQAVNILKDGEIFAIFLNASYIKVEANKAWQQMPKIFNSSMNPDPNGPIHFTSLSVTFQNPDTIITKLSGFDERPWPDVNFVFTIKDTFDTDSFDINVDSQNDLDADLIWMNWLTGIFLIVFPPLGIGFLAENIIVRINEGEQEAYDDGGVGKQIASALPKEIMIEGGKKITFLYNRIDISNGGIFGGGIALPVERTPSVAIRGPENLTSNSNSSYVSKQYKAITEDLRGNLRYDWKVNEIAQNRNNKSPIIRFNLDQSQPGQIIEKKLSLTVTDEDGLIANAEKIIKIHISLDDETLPPICRIKPFLPQCQPHIN